MVLPALVAPEYGDEGADSGLNVWTWLIAGYARKEFVRQVIAKRPVLLSDFFKPNQLRTYL